MSHICSTCGRQFGRRYNLKIHIQNVHNSEHEEDDKQCICQTCGKSFTRKYVLKKHQETIHNGLPYQQLVSEIKELKTELKKRDEKIQIKLKERDETIQTKLKEQR
jgi:DNA-directed RNA polymerase subunit RPC12/RpoP